MMKDTENWEEKFMKLGEEEYSKWKIDRHLTRKFIRHLLKSQREELARKINKAHVEFQERPTRGDVKNCPSKGCDHYKLGADNFYTDILAILNQEKK